MKLTWHDHEFELLPEKAMIGFHAGARCLFLADLHFGKGRFFQSKGLPLPADHDVHDVRVVKELIQSHRIDQIFILGDLFHNRRFSEFPKELLEVLPAKNWHWILGNHDRGTTAPSGIHTHQGGLLWAGLWLCHEPDSEQSRPQIVGHIHPAFVMKDGLDAVRAPCFWANSSILHLPSFGSTTGGYAIQPHAKDAVVIAVESQLISIQSGQHLISE